MAAVGCNQSSSNHCFDAVVYTSTVLCVACCVARFKTAQALILHEKMEVQEQESVWRYDGLGSRDAISRSEAMKNIWHVVMRKVEAIKPMPSGALSPIASVSPPNSELNDILAHLLMLSKRCPFEDIRDQSSQLLQSVQVGDIETLNHDELFVALSCPRLCLHTDA